MMLEEVKNFRRRLFHIDAQHLHDSEAPDIAKLKESLLEMTKSGDEKDRSTIILRADKRVDYGLIARVLSLAESLNLNVFLLTAAPAERKDIGRRLEEE